MGQVGTLPYMAPEMFSSSLANFSGQKADIFALGVVLYIMAFGKPPFYKADTKECKFWRMLANNPHKFFRLHANTKHLYKDDLIDTDL